MKLHKDGPDRSRQHRVLGLYRLFFVFRFCRQGALDHDMNIFVSKWDIRNHHAKYPNAPLLRYCVRVWTDRDSRLSIGRPSGPQGSPSGQSPWDALNEDIDLSLAIPHTMQFFYGFQAALYGHPYQEPHRDLNLRDLHIRQDVRYSR